MPTAKHWLTIAITALAVAGPQFVAAMPPEFRDLTSTIFAVLGSMYHLYQPSPTAR